MLSEATLAEFKAGLDGELIQPGDKGYDEARRVCIAVTRSEYWQCAARIARFQNSIGPLPVCGRMILADIERGPTNASSPHPLRQAD